jgi:predicted TIM-barrel fold metal-dependent hydrolase
MLCSFRIFALGFLLCISTLSWAGNTAARNAHVPYVDVHAHFAPGANLDFEKAVASAVATMDRYGIETTVVMSPPRSQKIGTNYDADNFRAALAKYPGRFAYLGGGGTLNLTIHSQPDPSRISDKMRVDFEKQAGRMIESGARGFGEMGGLHLSMQKDHGYSYVPVDHPLFLALADIAAEKDVVIDLHMDALLAPEPTPHDLSRFPNNPAMLPETVSGLEHLLTHNPDARIVWAHGGSDHLGDLTPKLIGELMDTYDNLYMSLRVTGPKVPDHNKLFVGPRLDPQWLALLIRHSDRFVIGTDVFYADPKAKGPPMVFSTWTPKKLTATALFLSRLPPDLAKKIGHDNAMRLYKLDKLESAPGAPAPAGSQDRAPTGKTCREGNLDHCRIACKRGHKQACMRLGEGG